MQRWRPKSRILRAKVIIYSGAHSFWSRLRLLLESRSFKSYISYGVSSKILLHLPFLHHPPPFPSRLYVLPLLFPPHGPLPCGIMGTYGPASTYRALNNCCSVPARCTNPPPPVLNTPGRSWSPRTGRCVPH